MRHQELYLALSLFLVFGFGSTVRAEYPYDSTMRGDYSYGNPSEGYYNSYGSGYDDNEAENDADEPKPAISNCAWVEAPGPSQTVTKVAAFRVPGCRGSGPEAPLVCSGIARCDVTILTNSGKKHTFNASFLNTMCTSNGNSCPQAEKCLASGGLLAQLRTPLEEHGNRRGSGKVFKPFKVDVKGKTHN